VTNETPSYFKIKKKHENQSALFTAELKNLITKQRKNSLRLATAFLPLTALKVVQTLCAVLIVTEKNLAKVS